MICIVESKAPKEVIRDGVKYRLYKRTRAENSEIMRTSYAELDYLANNPEELKNDDIKCVFIRVMTTYLVTLNIGLYDEYSGDIVVVDKDALRKFAGSEYMIEFIGKLINLRNRM